MSLTLRPLSRLLAFLLVAALIGCGDEQGSDGGASDGSNSKTEDSAPAELPDFATWAAGLLENESPDVLMKDPGSWFKAHFEATVAEALTVEYEAMSMNAAELPKLFADLKEKGQTVVDVTSFAKAPDREATGLQNTALSLMTTPATLYSARFRRPDAESGMHLWSFVQVGNTYKLAGKMRACNEFK